MSRGKVEIIRSLFETYVKRDREGLAALLAHDFTFTSPYDDAIDKAAYFERCWPNSLTIRENIIERIFEQGDEAFVTYRCIAADGKQFRNTEFFRFTGDKVRSVDVYFGATYRDGVFLPQQA